MLSDDVFFCIWGGRAAACAENADGFLDFLDSDESQ